jgi:hypothetical protein
LLEAHFKYQVGIALLLSMEKPLEAIEDIEVSVINNQKIVTMPVHIAFKNL